MKKPEDLQDLRRILYHYGVRNIPILGVSVSTMVHEYGHLICSKALGFNGFIMSEALTSVYHSTKPVGFQWTVFYLSGGLLQFLVFWLMSLKADDYGAKIADRMTALIGLVEGLVEPFRFFRLTGLGASLGIIFAFIYLAIEVYRIRAVVNSDK